MSQYSKISVSLPIELLIRLDIERDKTNHSRSAWLKLAAEEYMKKIEEDSSEERQSNLNL